MAKTRQLPSSPLADYLLRAAEFTLLAQIFATAIIFNGFFTNPLVNKFLLGQAFCIMAWVIYLMHCFFARKFTLVWSSYYIPAALFAGWAYIRSLTSPDAMALWSFYVFFTILHALPLWLTLFESKRFQMLYLRTVLITGGIVLFGCVYQFGYHLTHTYAGSVDIIPKWMKEITLTAGSYDRQFLGSFLGHNNHSMAYLVMVCIFAMLMLYRTWQTNWFIVYAVYIFVSLFIIVYGGSRSAFLMILPAFLAIGYGIYKQTKSSVNHSLSLKPLMKPLLFTIGGIVSVLIITTVILNTVGGGKVDSVFTRFIKGSDYLLSGTYPRVWLLSLYMFVSNPLTGTGFGAWAHQYPFYQESWFAAHPRTFIGLPEIGRYADQAHNDYLLVMAELGLPGLFLMAWIIMLHLRNIVFFFRQQHLPLLGTAAAACTLGTMVQMAFAFPFNVAPTACLFIANLALFAHFVPRQKWEMEPGFLKLPNNAWRWGGSVAAFILGVLMLYPVGLFTIGDFLANQKRTYFNGMYTALDAARISYAQNDLDTYQKEMNNYYFYYDFGMKQMENSFNYLPNRGAQLSNYGIEILSKGIQDQNTEALHLAIEYFNRSMDSYSFYDTFTHLGRAYRALWDIHKKQEDLDQALANFKQAVSILPTFHQGWLNYTSTLAEAGKQQESIDLLAEMELRYPGIINDGLFAVTQQAEAEGTIERAALIYNLAVRIKPDNPRLFQSTYDAQGNISTKGIIDFYIGIKRLDMAKRMLVGTAPYQKQDAVYAETIKVLLPMLNQKQYADAHDMMQQLLANDTLHESKQLHYYAGLTAWLAGDTYGCFAHLGMAYTLGVPMQQLKMLLKSTAELNFLPIHVDGLYTIPNG